jgi:hypothetical protein
MALGGYFSIVATGGYFLAMLLLCCIPRTAPFVETAWCCMGTRELFEPNQNKRVEKQPTTKSSVAPARTLQTQSEENSTVHHSKNTPETARLDSYDEEQAESSASDEDDPSASEDDDDDDDDYSNRS